MQKLIKKVFVLIVTILFSFTIFQASAVPKNENVAEIDVVINPESFQKLLQETNKGTGFPVSLSISQKTFPVTIKSRGNSSFTGGLNTSTKRLPYELSFEEKVTIGEIQNISSLKLNNCFSLYNLIAEYTALKIYEHMNVPVSEATPVFISFNSVDYGLYLGVEDIDKAFLLKHLESDSITNGNLYKSVDLEETPVIDNVKYFSTSFFGTLNFRCGNKNHKTLLAFLNAVEHGGDFEKYLDIDEVLRFFACTAVSGGTDTILCSTHNVYLYEYNGKISFIPWDLSCAFDCFDGGQTINPDATHCVTNDFFKLLMKNEDNKEKYYAYIEEIRETFLNPDISNAFIYDFLETIKPYYQRDRSMPFDQNLSLSNITSGNVLVNGNIILAVNEVYRQLGEQLTGKSENFYTPKSLKESLYDVYSDEDILSENDAGILKEIENNYWKSYILSSEGIVIVSSIFLLMFFAIFISIGKSKGRRRKRR